MKRNQVLGRFLVEPLDPAPATLLLARSDFVAVSEVNVTDPREYADMDAASLGAFSQQNNVSLGRSLETTHGLIRAQSDAPFVFVSGSPTASVTSPTRCSRERTLRTTSPLTTPASWSPGCSSERTRCSGDQAVHPRE